jgi:hypothetical protein
VKGRANYTLTTFISVYCEGKSACCLKAPPTFTKGFPPAASLRTYQESYGSGSTFAVANPYSAYWQDKNADTITKLVRDNGNSGVYVDQIGAASANLCWNATEGIAGGGDYWRRGYDSFLEKSKATVRAPVVTESNAEPYMAHINGYLTLVAFMADYAGNNGKFVPAFAAVYGGFTVSFGQEWSRADFDESNNADSFVTKLAVSFAAGAQMGWMSLVAINKPGYDSCGQMGIGDLVSQRLY